MKWDEVDKERQGSGPSVVVGYEYGVAPFLGQLINFFDEFGEITAIGHKQNGEYVVELLILPKKEVPKIGRRRKIRRIA